MREKIRKRDGHNGQRQRAGTGVAKRGKKRRDGEGW